MCHLVARSSLMIVCLAWPAPQEPPDASAGDDAKFQELTRRYREIVEARPQRGTAFDAWYRLYLDAGRLDELVATVERAARVRADDHAAQIIAGLVSERRGQFDEAVRLYSAAEKLAPDNFFPPYLLGMALAGEQRFEEAAAALERATERGPPRAELLDIQKQLVRLYLRHGKSHEALDVLARIAERFPDDRLMIEELAELLTDEEQCDEAERRWEQVAALAKDDPQRRLRARIEIAQIQARRGEMRSSVATLDRVLDQVDPESWLAKDVVRRIEELFERKQDLNGLATYYFERHARHPDELGTMIRLAAVLAQGGKSAEAIDRFRAAKRLAPSRRDVRESLVRELVRAGRFDDAIAECTELAERFANDADVLRLLGTLHLDAPSAQHEDAQRAAISAWRRIAAIRPTDPTLAVQVAELCRRAARISDATSFQSKWTLFPPAAEKTGANRRPSPLVETAEEFYREAVRRAAGVPQYHEYLGEFLHALGRRDGAIAAFTAMTAGPNDTAENWHRLAEVAGNFNLLDAAIDAGEKALAREPDNFGYHELQTNLLAKRKDFDRALEQVAHLERLADTPFLREKSLNRRVEMVSAAGRAEQEIERLRRLQQSDQSQPRDLWMLALLQAQRFQYAQAAATLDQALRLKPDDSRLLSARAGMLERSGNRAAAVQVYRRLVALDQNPTLHYERIAQLELERGRAEAAKEAVQALVRLAPANLDAYRLKADVAFRLRDVETGLAALRQAVRIAPRDASVRQQLAKALADNRRSEEALEHYWRAFELEESLADKLSLVKVMAKLPAAGLDGEKLLERLRQIRRRADDPRVMTLCIVELLRLTKNYVAARRELTDLLAGRRDDVDLLQQLTALAEEQKDWSSAVGFQERIVVLLPNRENLETLARFHRETGDEAAEERVWSRILDEIQDESAFADAVERLAMKANYRDALRLAEFALARRPDDWRLLFWAGCSHFVLGQGDAAREKFEAVLALPPNTNYDKPGGQSATPSSLLRAPAVGAQVVTTSTGTRMIVNQPPFLPSAQPGASSPELEDCSAAKLAAGRFSALRTLGALLKQTGATARATTSQAAQLQNQRLVQQQRLLSGRNATPLSQRAAQIESMIALGSVGVPSGGNFIAAKHAAAVSDPTHLRDLLLYFQATNQDGLFQDVAAELAVRLPDDPLPHVARLTNVEAPVRQQPGQQSAQQRDRQRRYEAMRASFEWLSEHQPPLAALLGYNYCYNLLVMGYSGDAVEYISTELDAAVQVQQVVGLVGLAQTTRDASLMRKVFLRAAELAGTTNDPAVIQYFEVLLTQGFLSNLKDDDLATALEMFDQYMRNTHPQRGGSAGRVSARPRVVSGSVQPVAGSTAAAQLGISLEFPCPSSLLEMNRYSVLGAFHARVSQSNLTPKLVEHLAREAERTRDNARRAYKMAEICVRWWSSERVAPVEALEQLANELPGDPEPRLLLAKALYSAGNHVNAFTELSRLRDGGGIRAREVETMRSLCTRLLLSGPVERLFAVLMCELEGESEPQVGPFLAEAWPAANAARSTAVSNRAQAAYAAQPNQATIVAPAPAAPSQPPAIVTRPATPAKSGQPAAGAIPRTGPEPSLKTRLPELLDFARQQKKLDTLDRLASEQWEKYPANLHLGALVTLTRFARADVPAAHDAARRWAESFASIKNAPSATTSLMDLYCFPEMLMIAGACLRQPDTRPIGDDLMRQVLETATRRGWVEMQQAVLADMTNGFIGDGQLDEARNLLTQVEQLLEKDQSLSRASRAEVSVFVVYRLAALAGRVHPSLVPAVLEMIAGRVAEHHDKVRQPWLLTMPLDDALTKVARDASPDERRRVIAGVQSIVFAAGAGREPLLFAWHADGPPTGNGGLGRILVAEAQSAGELEHLRRQWDAHAAAGSMSMLVLRAEAALAAGDLDAADKLRAELAKLEKTSKTEAPLWSSWFLFRGFAAKHKAEFHQDFRGHELDKQSLELTWGDASTSIEEHADGLRIRMPSGVGSIRGVGVNSRFQVQGDFEVIASYEILDLPRPAGVAGLVLEADFGDAGLARVERLHRGDNSGLPVPPTSSPQQTRTLAQTGAVGRRVDQSGLGQGYTIHRAASRAGRIDHWERYYPTETRSGKLRLIRRGATIYYLVAEGASDEFRLLYRADISAADVRSIRAVADARTPTNRTVVDVRLLDLTVRAEELPRNP